VSPITQKSTHVIKCVGSNISTHTLHQKEVWPLTQTQIRMPQSSLIHLSIKT